MLSDIKLNYLPTYHVRARCRYNGGYISLALADNRTGVVNVWQGGRYKPAALLIVTTTGGHWDAETSATLRYDIRRVTQVAEAFDHILSTASPSIITVRRQTHWLHPPTDRLTSAWIGRWVAGGSVELSVSPVLDQRSTVISGSQYLVGIDR